MDFGIHIARPIAGEWQLKKWKTNYDNRILNKVLSYYDGIDDFRVRVGFLGNLRQNVDPTIYVLQ